MNISKEFDVIVFQLIHVVFFQNFFHTLNCLINQTNRKSNHQKREWLNLGYIRTTSPSFATADHKMNVFSYFQWRLSVLIVER